MADKIFLGADHAGYDLKNKISKYLNNHGFVVNDLSPNFIKGDDYPKPAFKVARAVRQNTGSRGILVCGSGVGVAIAANRIKGIRAADACDEYTAKMSRKDEDSNVLCLRARFFPEAKTKKIIHSWLSTKFSNKSRHKRRIKELDS